MLCLMTGCEKTINCVAYGLPQGAKTCFLAKNISVSDPFDHSNLKNTEIGSYSEDGWHRVSYITDDAESAKKAGPIKIAVYDEKGNILKISPEFSLAIKDKNYYWNRIAYNYASNTIEGAHAAKIDDTMTLRIVGLLFIDFFCFLLFVVLVAGTNEQHYKKYPFFAALLNIPNALLIVLWRIDAFSSYYQKPRTNSGSGAMAEIFIYLFFLSAVIILNVSGFRNYLNCREAAISYQKEDKASE